MSPPPIRSLGIIGGTGPMGRGLATRLAAAGLEVVLGSRDFERAEAAATEIRNRVGADAVRGATNAVAASQGELTLLTVPYQAGSPIVVQLTPELEGRVLVSTAAPMEFRERQAHPLRPAAGSAAREVADLCPKALVVGAFHTVSAPTLGRLELPLDEDVIVTSDHPAARALVLQLVALVPGLVPVDGGELANSSFSEGLTPFLLRLNRLHHCNTGIHLTGLPAGRP